MNVFGRLVVREISDYDIESEHVVYLHRENG